MKKLLTLVLALCLVMSLCASASAVTIAFSQIGQESDWRTANTDSIKAAIEGHEGWELIYDDAQQKQENQIKALRNFITQGVDVLIINPVNSSSAETITNQVTGAGIPLVYINREPDEQEEARWDLQ